MSTDRNARHGWCRPDPRHSGAKTENKDTDPPVYSYPGTAESYPFGLSGPEWIMAAKGNTGALFAMTSARCMRVVTLPLPLLSRTPGPVLGREQVG